MSRITTVHRARAGARILVDALRIHGADRIFCVPGESYLAVLDALYDAPAIQLIVCRHEGGAANMAEADGKLTGRPGICFVTRGPGAAHASVGVHTAFQDSTPMILFVGQVPRGHRGREAFQEIDHARWFAPISKWAAEVDDAARLPEFVARAFRIATSGRAGPVVLALPEDMLGDQSAAADTLAYQPAQSSPSGDELARLKELLAAAERPVAIVGGGGWTETARHDFATFAEANRLPVAASFRRQHLIDNSHASYIGHLGFGVSPKLVARVKAADLLIAIGARLGEATTGGYSLIEPPIPHARLVHVHAGAEELGRVYDPTLGINAGMPQIAAALRHLPPIEEPRWRDWALVARAEYEEFAAIPPAAATKWIDATRMMACVERNLPPDAIVTNGAGNFALWVHRFHRYRGFGSQLAPTSGAMGYGLPAAISAKLRCPDRPVICFAGDGDFMMYPQELITARRYGLPIIVIIVNNGMYGTIRMHQEARYPGRALGTDLLNPDFAALARSFGISGETTADEESFAAALERALAADGPSVIEVPIDPAQVTPDRYLS